MSDSSDLERVATILAAGKAAGFTPAVGETLSEYSERVVLATAQQPRAINSLLILRIALAAITATTGIIVF